jgi:hypothetical protein
MADARGAAGVVPSRKPRLQRVGPAAPFRLTGSQREVLTLLHEYSFLTPRLLALAYGSREGRDGRGYWHIQRELRRLFDAGLVEKFPASVTAVRRGSTESIYAITHQGAREILDAVEYSALRHNIYNREGKQRANFGHHLAIASLQLVLTLGQAGWKLVEFRAEDRDPRACVRVRVRERVLTAWPDAAAVIESGRGESKLRRRTTYLFEIDLTRKNNQRVADRFLAYAAYLSALRRDTPAATARPAAEHLVVFVVPSEAELERFLGIAGETLTEHRLANSASFLFWVLTDWFTPSDAPGAASTLLSPRDILRAKTLSTLTGDARRLVEEAGPR